MTYRNRHPRFNAARSTLLGLLVLYVVCQGVSYADAFDRLPVRKRSDGSRDPASAFPGHAAADTARLIGPDYWVPSYLGNFESNGLPALHGWTFVDLSAGGVGSFGQVWPLLEDMDSFTHIHSPRVAFIDDGLVVPSVGPSPSAYPDYGYGPDANVTNSTGGLVGPGARLHCAAVSPVLDFTLPNLDGVVLAFDVYVHEVMAPWSSGMLYTWEVRSQAGADPWTEWRDRGNAYYGGPDNIRHVEDVSDLLAPAADRVQVRLGIIQTGYHWGADGNAPSPAPYFDNVRVDAFNRAGPFIYIRGCDQAQDSFSQGGNLDLSVLGNNSVPVDIARSTSLPNLIVNTPGDYIECNIVPRRGGVISSNPYIEDPRLFYRITENPLFGPSLRTSGLASSGSVFGVSMGGNVWRFDLPDEGFLFPGDVLRYYIRAEDNVANDLTWTLLPNADELVWRPIVNWVRIFDLDEPGVWPESFTMRALPTLSSADPVVMPSILLWVDSDNEHDLASWRSALNQAGYAEGIDFDVYLTKGASSGVGSGLGGRVNLATLSRYGTILYDSGDQPRFTLSEGGLQSGDPTDDIGLLEAWLAGGRNLLAVGNGLAGDLSRASTAGAAFVADRLGVELVADDVRPSIGGQNRPLVKMLVANPLNLLQDIVAYRAPDHPLAVPRITTTVGTVRLAEFAAASGIGNQYPASIAAMTYRQSTGGARCVFAPMRFLTWYDPEEWTGGKTDAPLSARAVLLEQILQAFGVPGSSTASDVLPARQALDVAVAPNPFNPAGEIRWRLERPGSLSIRIYSVRGELVRSLHEGTVVETQGRMLWRGDDDAGRAVASGVYFYEVRAGDEVRHGKMALVR